MIKAYRALQEVYKKLDMSTEEWIRLEKPPFTRETANKVLRRGDQLVNGISLALIGQALNMSSKEIVTALAAYGKEQAAFAPECEAIIQLIDPVDTTKEEHTLIKKFRKLDAAKQALVANMIKSL